jgi:ferrous-iron efflux pump FieF
MKEAAGAAAVGADENRRSYQTLKRMAAVASVSVASVLIAAKLGGYLATGAVSLLSTLIDSLLDLAASVINFIAVQSATQPADREHRFGHGKAEPLAGLAQAAFVGGSAVFLFFEASQRLIHPKPIINSTAGIGVMVLSIILTLGLVLFQRFVIKRTGSIAIVSDSLHYRADLLVNLSVIVALVLAANFGWTIADPLFAITIGVYILYSAWQIFSGSLNLLMDRELPEDDRERIKKIALGHEGVISIHDLRTRSSGTHTFIQFHLEMDGNVSLRTAHDISDAVMEDIELAFPNAEVLIHEDPFGVPERRVSFD